MIDTESETTWFLRYRTDFIRSYYETAAEPFRAIVCKIEAGEPPFDHPPGVEDGEPPFMEQWSNAETALDVLGQSCVSLLSDTLKLFFDDWSSRIVRFSLDPHEKAIMKKEGFVAAYRAALGEIFDTDWSDCPVRFDIIEQVVLARNRAQHGASLMTLRISHDPRTLGRHPVPHFARASEAEAWADGDGEWSPFMAPAVSVSRETLFTAIDEIERLADWLDAEIDRAWRWLAKDEPAGADRG